jgi:Protein of unknown function (DUF3617)
VKILKEDEMRRLIVVGVVCFSATVLLAQTQKTAQETARRIIPINVKTGLWEGTSKITTSGSLGIPPELAAKLTPEQRAKYEAAMQSRAGGQTTTNTEKSCLTEKDLTTDPFEKKDPDDRIKCHESILNSSSSDVEIQESCTGEVDMTFKMKIHADDREHAHGTGEGTTTMGGRTMQSKIEFESKWLGATCPAEKN